MKILGAEWIATADGPRGFPRTAQPEVALAGRSNVGKSSLLTRLAGRRGLARSSRTPGKTRQIHFYAVRRSCGAITLVDLPGYGYARVSRAERRHWKELVESYLGGRSKLRGVVLLADIRRDVTDDERELLAWLAERGIARRVALTKVDKLPPMRRAQRVRELARAFGLPAEHLIATSAQRGIGIRELWSAVDACLAEAPDPRPEAGPEPRGVSPDPGSKG